ncbi:MAG: T9SS type A sorting domain-containing protein [Prevotella sp.]|nr:T9SS type A sorting domain-containing protein [Prevotella sp.]
MNKIKVFLWTLLVLFGSISASAQTSNKLSISTVPSPIGKDILVPIQMENTDEIVGLQFDITVSDKINILNETVSTNRWDDHVAVVKSLGNGRSRVMVYSSSNKPFKGNSGNILLLKARASESCVEGEEYPVNFGETVLTKSNGENCVTASQDGKIIIMKSPDLTPEWITVNKTSVNPTDTIQCSWRVKNIGGLPTTGGWKEQVFAVSEDGKYQVLLGTQYCDNTIPSQGETVRSFKVSLPEVPGIDGKCSLMIKIVPDANCGEPTSMTGNNSCQSTQSINIAKCLYLADIKQAVDESSSTPLKYKLTRSGSTLQKETFTIDVKHPDSRVTLPATVEIPRNHSSAYFYVTLAANGKLDESDSVEFSIIGNEYPKVSSVLSIIDDTFPKLNAVLSKEEVKEGESFTLTIELPRSFTHDKTIFLSSDNSAKIKVPAEIVIPSGQNSVSVPLTVIDNDDAELETTVTIRATADGLDSENCEIIVQDDDMPTLSLSFSPSEVSENAGVSAVIATVKRLTNVDKNVKLLLFDDSKGAIELSHKTLSMGKGVESVQFIIDIKDNDKVDGDKHYNVTAAVYSSACDCYASELSGGLVSQTLTVLDDDGPHLSIASASQAFLEGSSDNVITITRNTNPDSDITVTISSDKDDLLDYNHSVVIPLGAMSADVKVSVLGNETSGDGDIVSFKAESADMAAGSCWVVLTDQTLPDATIQLEVAQESPSAGESVDLILTISNIGNAPLQRNTPIDIECTGVKGTKRVYTKKAIEKGDNDRLVVEDFQLPARTGLVTLSAVINENESVTELLYSNNKARSVELTLSPAFDVTASVDKNIYTQEESVIISGHASGDAGKNAKIEIHLSNNGVRQVLNATTDDDGNYEYKYKLLPRQTGHFTVSACYPKSSPVEDAATFDVYGLQLNKAFITCEPGLGETFNGTFRLSNPGNLSQNSLKIEKVSVPANCEFTFDAPSKIDAGETIDIKFSLKGTGLSKGKEFEKIPLSITTEEGTKTTFTVYYYIQSLHGKLYTSTPSISTTMQKDTPRDYPLVIRNIGKGETGKISFALPSWVETATPREMASLAAGDSTTVMLRFKPMDEMKLNVATKGKLGINCSNGDGISVSFDIMPVSEAVGKLKIDVVDEFTFYTEEAPHVSNAQIKITHPTSKEVIVEGRTNNDGIFTAGMNEGWYIMTVEADNHDIYTENIIISPGEELNKEVFMPYQAITYNWNVEETEIEDEYVFETTVDFDTRVPKPVIVISLPDEKPEPYSVIPVKITNKGLINAVNIEMSLEVSDGYTLEFLNDPTAEVLAPQQTLVFYAKLLPTESSSEVRAKAPRANRECIWIISKAKYQELCQKYTGDQFVRMLKKYGKKSCFKSGSSSGGSGGHGSGYGGSGSVGRPGCWGGGSSYGSDYYVIDWSNPEKYCDRKPGSNPQDGDDNENPEEPLAPEGEPEENEDCDEEPYFKFNVTEVNSRAIRKGVAADGVSQVKISLDPSSRVPKEECGYSYEWFLSDDVGDLSSSDTYKEVIYTAPIDYPDETSDRKIINAYLRYTKDGVSKEVKAGDIEIWRVPLVLLHGLHDNGTCWSEFARELIRDNIFNENQIDTVGYEKTNCRYFTTNVGVPQRRINVLFKKYKDNQIVVNKADLVGHSMGGILSRLHVQYIDNKNVHKVITANTPHSGSELGDIVSLLPLTAKIILFNWIKIKGFNSFEAISDLAVDSYSIDNYLNNSSALKRMDNIPVHAIVTESRFFDDTVPEFSKNVLCAIIQFSRGLGYNHLNEIGTSDYVVSVQSQKGGLQENNINYIEGPWHCESTHNENVKQGVRNALLAKTESPIFAHSGFHPLDRKFHFEDKESTNSMKRMVSLQNDNERFLNVSIEGDSLSVDCQGGEDVSNMVIIQFADNQLHFGSDKFKCEIPKTHEGGIRTLGVRFSHGEIVSVDSTFIDVPNSRLLPVDIFASPMMIEIDDTVSVSSNVRWQDGSVSTVYPEIISSKGFVSFNDNQISGLKIGKDTIVCRYRDIMCKIPVRVFGLSENHTKDNSDAICSTVTLSFKQSAVMTRQAFRGIFSLNNGHQTAALRDFKLNLEVKDENGVVATRREFEITPEKLAGFQGGLDFNSGWSLEPSHNGEASILFIPTKYAAPTESKEYSFGGTFSYIDPYTGLTVTRTLNPVTLTVNPSPQLELTYFMQRDVFGDDPLTEEIEPMKPSEFALLLNNIGAGDATSLKLTTGQPQIVSNEKGLYVNFELISSQLNGGEHSMMLGGSSVTDFGSLKAGEQSYAQWWLQSSLLGHFVKYDVKSTHVTSHDNPDLSLVDTVTIHELIHGFDLTRDDIKRRAFLVNDITDVLDTPDQLYFTDGTKADVAIARDAFITKESDLEYILNISASAPGWNYGTISDPTNGRQSLSSIKRMSDGMELAIDNFWQTDRTLRDGKDPLAENLLHFIDNFSNGDASYRLTFTPKPDIELAVDSVIGLSEEDDILSEQLKTVTVKFNKPIDPSTFTVEDLSLSCQGERIDISQVTITSKTDTEYVLDLSSVTLENGFYVLSIQTTSISDAEGFAGATGKQVSWIQYVDGKVKLTTVATPVEGGSVTPVTGLYDYDSTVKLQATPSAGYNFLGWWCGDDLISETPETEASLTEDKEYTARFALQQFKISVDCNGEGGYVDGAATGIYDFGQVLKVEAVPNYGWSFSHWTVNGSDVSDGTNILELPINHDTELYATFVSHIKESTIPLYQGWNWISSVFDDKNLYNPMQFFKSIKPTLTEVRTKDGGLVLDGGILDGSIERMIPGTYKIKVNNTTSLKIKGATVSEDDYELSLSQGWNWIPYVPTNEQSISDALVNLAAKENDILKSHTQFAVFSDGRWLGTLKSFVPNEGYMYYANEPASFKFQSSVVSNFSATTNHSNPWQYNEKGFADNKTIIAQILDNGIMVSEDDYLIGAFCGDECRGIGEYVEGSLFITVHGQQGDNISFKAIDNISGEIRDAKESITFDENPLGSISIPYSLNLDISSGINDILVGYGLRISPNPVKDILYIEGNLSDVKSVKVIATSGLTLISTDTFENGISVTSLSDGVYVAAIATTHGIVYKKFLKKGY